MKVKNEVRKVFIRIKKNEIIKIKTSMLCVSGGFNPDIHLFTQSKGLLKWDENLLTFKPDKIFQNTITLGSVSGNFIMKNLLNEINKKLNFLEGVNDLDIKLNINGPKKFQIKEVMGNKTVQKIFVVKIFYRPSK